MSLYSFRRSAYKTGRILGDIESAKHGPSGVAKRIVRRKVYARTNRALYRALRRVGLSR